MNNYSRHPSVSKEINEGIALYRLDWSALFSCSKDRIITTVPSLPGLWEIYVLEKLRTLKLLKMGRAWYGGLRHELRVEIDGGDPRNIDFKEYLLSGNCYYRYVVCEVFSDLEEVYDVVSSIRGLPGPSETPKQRYREVRVSEPDKLIIHRRKKPNMSMKEEQEKYVPNMFDVLEYMKKHNSNPEDH